jgi:hypothetical protein
LLLFRVRASPVSGSRQTTEPRIADATEEIMRKPGAAVAVLLLFFCAACSVGESTDVATKAVADFRIAYYEGGFDKLYNEAGQELRDQITRADWNKLMRVITARLGQVRSQSDPAWNVSTSPKGTFVTLVYQIEFEKGKATESFVWRVDGQKVQLIGYHINSLALLSE